MAKKISEKIKAEVIWTFTRSGAFQRAWIYGKKTNEADKEDFRNNAKTFLFEKVFKKFFGKRITENQLFKLIDEFISEVGCLRGLAGNKIRFGNAQKFVNLYLKGMWICGYIKEPPHFPVDSIMLRKLKMQGPYTQLNITDYKKVISKAKENIKQTDDFKTIAEWEAQIYQLEYVDKK